MRSHPCFSEKVRTMLTKTIFYIKPFYTTLILRPNFFYLNIFYNLAKLFAPCKRYTSVYSTSYSENSKRGEIFFYRRVFLLIFMTHICFVFSIKKVIYIQNSYKSSTLVLGPCLRLGIYSGPNHVLL